MGSLQQLMFKKWCIINLLYLEYEDDIVRTSYNASIKYAYISTIALMSFLCTFSSGE